MADWRTMRRPTAVSCNGPQMIGSGYIEEATPIPISSYGGRLGVINENPYGSQPINHTRKKIPNYVENGFYDPRGMPTTHRFLTPQTYKTGFDSTTYGNINPDPRISNYENKIYGYNGNYERNNIYDGGPNLSNRISYFGSTRPSGPYNGISQVHSRVPGPVGNQNFYTRGYHNIRGQNYGHYFGPVGYQKRYILTSYGNGRLNANSNLGYRNFEIFSTNDSNIRFINRRKRNVGCCSFLNGCFGSRRSEEGEFKSGMGGSKPRVGVDPGLKAPEVNGGVIIQNERRKPSR